MWLREGAKGVLASWRKGLPRVSCTIATLFCTSAAGFQNPDAPKPLWHPLLTTKSLDNLEDSGLCARQIGSQCTHTHIYIYMLWCYYLGQVWPFEVLLSGPSLFFTKHCLSKKHYKNRGFSTFFLEKKIARANLRCYYLGQVGHF